MLSEGTHKSDKFDMYPQIENCVRLLLSLSLGICNLNAMDKYTKY
jgi:hypothetical protein